MHVLDAHRLAPLLVRGSLDDESGEDLAVQAAHRRGGEDPFRRTARAHDRVHAASDDSRGDTRREIAVGDESNACAGRADLLDDLFVSRTIEDDHDEILDLALQAPRNRPQVVDHRRVQAHSVLGTRADDELFHVEVGGVQQAAAV